MSFDRTPKEDKELNKVKQRLADLKTNKDLESVDFQTFDKKLHDAKQYVNTLELIYSEAKAAYDKKVKDAQELFHGVAGLIAAAEKDKRKLSKLDMGDFARAMQVKEIDDKLEVDRNTADEMKHSLDKMTPPASMLETKAKFDVAAKQLYEVTALVDSYKGALEAYKKYKNELPYPAIDSKDLATLSKVATDISAYSQGRFGAVIKTTLDTDKGYIAQNAATALSAMITVLENNTNSLDQKLRAIRALQTKITKFVEDDKTAVDTFNKRGRLFSAGKISSNLTGKLNKLSTVLSKILQPLEAAEKMLETEKQAAIKLGKSAHEVAPEKTAAEQQNAHSSRAGFGMK